MKRKREAATREPVSRALGGGVNERRQGNATFTVEPRSRAFGDSRNGRWHGSAVVTAGLVSRAAASERRRIAAAHGPVSQVRNDDTNGGEWR